MTVTLLFALLVCRDEIQVTPLSGSDGWVVLADTDRFGGCYQTARLNYMAAAGHRAIRGHEIASWNPPETFGRWERECQWRTDCWHALQAALDVEGYSRDTRLHYLNTLRFLLGEDAYWQGVMPSPFPAYRGN